jgi:hypothetical protein
MAVGALSAAFAAYLIHSSKIEAPLFAQAPGVPSVSASAPSPQWATAVDRARPLVRAAIMQQNLPGVSIAVGIGGALGNIVWAEGFGGTSSRICPSHPILDSTSALRQRWSLQPRSRPST